MIESMNPSDLAAEAARLVTGDRNEAYGHPLDNLDRAARIWSVILGSEITAEQVCLCMEGMKIAREINAPKLDNIIDGCGYWLTLAMVRQERTNRLVTEETR